MIIKTFDELRQTDERTLRFTPMGLGARMRPEDAAKYQQQVVAQFGLNPSVSEGTGQSFEQLCTVYALLAIEQALRDRFVELHQGTVTFVDGAGVDHPIAVSRYEGCR